MSVAFVGVGTNMGDRLQNIKDAVKSIELLPNTKVVNISKIYETLPWGVENQPNFLNGVLKVETDFSAFAFLGCLLGIEASMGRVRTIKNGPRIIDLDLLIFEDEVINTTELTLPHPFIEQREFVLKPLLDVLSSEKYLKVLEKLEQGTVWLYES